MMPRSIPRRLKKSLTRDAAVEFLEDRALLSAAHDIVGLTALRADTSFGEIDGRLPNGQRIGVAVIDTGVAATHTDLRERFLVYVDGFLQASTEQISLSRDPDGHGTHVAGTVLGGFSPALNDTVGVAPNAGLVAMNGLAPTASRSISDAVLWNLNWVLQNHQRYNIKVVNMSLGTPIDGNGSHIQNFNSLPAANDYHRVIRQLEAAGIVVVSASGNSFVHFNSAGQSHPAVFSTFSVGNTLAERSDPYFPGDGLPTMQRAGVDLTPTPDEFNVGSQRSTMPNQVAAPGTNILSTWNDGRHNSISGTSMASPMVAGLVALMQDAAITFGGRYLLVPEIHEIVTSTADIIVDQADPSTRRGLVDQMRAFLQGQIPFSALEDLVETGQSFRRINIQKAVAAVRTLVTQPATGGGGQTPAVDTNNTLEKAVEFPAINATESFSVRGRIGTDGQVEVGANDVDLFKVVLQTRGQIDVLTSRPDSGQAFNAYLRLFNQQGTQIQFDDNSGPGNYAELRSPTLAAGVYFVGVSSHNNTSYNPVTGAGATNGGSQGDYVLTIASVNPDPNGVIQGAEAIDLVSPDYVFPDGHPAKAAGIFVANKVSSLIGSDPHPLHASDPQRYPERIEVGPTDVDMFRVVAPDNGVLYVDIQARSVYGVNAVDSFVRVYRQAANGTLTMVGENDDRDAGNTDSFLAVNVEIGATYFIALTTFGNRSFLPLNPYGRSSTSNEMGLMDAYISFSNGDVNGTAFSNVSLNDSAPGGIGTFQGVIGSDFGIPLAGAQQGFKDVDFMRITPDQTGAFEVSVTSPDGSLVSALGIWRLNETQSDIVQVMNNVGQSPTARFSVTAGQTFWISITGEGNTGFNWAAPGSGTGGDTGNYELRTAFLTATNFRTFSDNSINLNVPTPISLNRRIDAVIGRDGDTAVGASDVDIYVFRPTASQRVTIRAGNNGAERGADVVLRVFDANGTEIAFNNNEHDRTRDAGLTLNVVAGETYFVGVNGHSANARRYNPINGAGGAPGSTGPYSITISRNSAPVMSAAGTPFLDSIRRGISSAENRGTRVSAILSRLSPNGGVSDADPGEKTGIAISSIDTSNGQWQFSTNDGATWTNVGAVSNTDVRLLTSEPGSRLRFVPKAGFAGSAAIRFFAWDRTRGTNGGRFNVSARGGATAFSTQNKQATILVNTAPVLNAAGNPFLDSIRRGMPISENQGTRVSAILNRMSPGGGVSDADPGSQTGIAINAVDQSNGRWQFSVNDGATWTNLSPVSNTNARLLTSQPGSRVRFLPNAGFAGSAVIRFFAWDRTQGTNGGRFNAGNRGDATAFSVQNEQATILVNTAPVLNAAGEPFLNRISPDIPVQNNPGTLVSLIISRMSPGGGISDSDPGSLRGIAVNFLGGTNNGTWQYSVDDGQNWRGFGQVSNTSALLLSAVPGTRIRFLPKTGFAGDVHLRFFAWDRTSGSNGSRANVSTRGGATAFSAQGEQATLSVALAPRRLRALDDLFSESLFAV